MNENVDIFVYSHKPFTPLVKDPVYKILTNCHASGEQFHTSLPIYRDYIGENISDKNLMYNEYSGFYWLWKNWKLKDYIGMVHYRRYFSFLDDVPDINQIFSEKRIILNSRLELPSGNREFYQTWHNIKDFDLMGRIVKETFPDMVEGWDTMCETKHIHPSSLFIMPKDLYDEYCNFIFTCLGIFNAERKCFTREDWIVYVAENEKDYIRPGQEKYTYGHVIDQARAVGFLAERCLMAFLLKGGENCLENNSFEMKWGVWKQKKH